MQVPVTMPKRVTMPVGMAIIIFFQGISNLLCTPVAGYIIGEAQAWANVAPLCAGTAAVGTVLWIVYVLTKPPVFEEDEDASGERTRSTWESRSPTDARLLRRPPRGASRTLRSAPAAFGQRRVAWRPSIAAEQDGRRRGHGRGSGKAASR